MSPGVASHALFDLVQTIGIILSLLLSAWLAYKQHRSQQVDSLIRVTQSHRELWLEALSRPELARVAEPDVDLDDAPVSHAERLFVLLVALHLQSVVEATRLGVLRPIWGLEKDIERFFSAPIAASVWEEFRGLQAPEFRDLIDRCRRKTSEKETPPQDDATGDRASSRPAEQDASERKER